jgi:GNAT superfamily N-acetyltransferase
VSQLATRELTRESFPDLEEVLGERGGAHGCWCMHWRLSFNEWKEQQGDGNRRTLQKRAGAAPPAGLIGYLDDRPVGWIALGDRDEYPRMARSPVMRPVDETRVWVVSCIFVHPDVRGQDLPVRLIEAACTLAAEHGQEAVDAVPVEVEDGKRAGPDNAMTGMASSFQKAGFREIARPKPDRPYVRRRVDDSS